jgi:hypothetical protein
VKRSRAQVERNVRQHLGSIVVFQSDIREANHGGISLG